jgi:hypothetical protein
VGFSELAHPVSVTYAELVSPEQITTDILYGVRFHSPDNSHTEGPEALTVKLSMSIMRIVWGAVGGVPVSGTSFLPL